MIDPHCHLDMLSPEELQHALQAAADFQALITIGTNPKRNPLAIALAEQHPHIWAAVGLHPTDAEQLNQAAIDQLYALAQHPKVKAIGETGLDYYWTPHTKEQQFAALEVQAELAKRLGLPLIFHVRDKNDEQQAALDLSAWLLATKPPAYVLHSFTGNPHLLEAALQTDGYFSFSGPLTFKKSHALREALKLCPLDRIMVETDAPFLSPEPHRSKRNHPALCRHTLAVLANTLEVGLLEAEQLTDTNAKRLFNL